MLKKIENILNFCAITLDLACIIMNITSFNAYIINQELLERTKTIEQSLVEVENKVGYVNTLNS